MTTLVGSVLLACLILLSVFYLIVASVERWDDEKMPGWVMHLLASWGVLSVALVLMVPVANLFGIMAGVEYLYPNALNA